SRAFYRVALQQLEMFLHVLLGEGVLAAVHALGDGEDQEKAGGKGNAGHRGDRLGEEIHDGGTKQHQKHRGQAKRNLVAGDGDIWWDLPATFAFVFDAQHQHGQAIEGEAPYDTESVSLTQQIDITVAYQNGEK